MSKKNDEEFKLEEAFKELEDIIEKLEGDDISLKESIALYGDGAKLLASCKEELTGIEKEMIIIDEKLRDGEDE